MLTVCKLAHVHAIHVKYRWSGGTPPENFGKLYTPSEIEYGSTFNPISFTLEPALIARIAYQHS